MPNRSAINTATLNSIVPDVVQRTVLTSRAFAVVYARATVLSRGPVVCRSGADATVVSRLIHRSSVTCSSEAIVTCSGAERTRSAVTASCRSDLSISTSVYPRQFFASPVLSANRSQGLATGKARYRAQVASTQRANVVARAESVFYLHRSPVSSQCRALITVDYELIKKIPFTGRAPEDRTIDWSGESREMTWL